MLLLQAPTCLPGHFSFHNTIALVWGYECSTFLILGQTNRLETTPIDCKLTDADLIVEVPFTIVCKNVFTIPSFKLNEKTVIRFTPLKFHNHKGYLK